MRKHFKPGSIRSISLLTFFLFFHVLSAAAQDCNCDHTIPLTQEIIKGEDLSISPGDTICIEAGLRKSLWFQNFQGTAENPLVFINCGGQAVISNTTKWGISFSNSKHFKLLGTGDPKFKYGIKIDGVATVGVSFNRRSTDFEAAYIEVNKSLGPGCMAKTDPECGKPETWRENFAMKNISIHHFYIHDVGTKNGGGEGFYIGHSFFLGIDTSCGKLFPHDIQNIKVHDNIIENTAYDGMQVSCAVAGTEVYNNSIKNYGTLNNGSQQTGLVVGGGSKGKFYNNTIDKGTGAGITVFGQGDVYVYNNVVSNALQDGIFIDDRTTTAGLGFHFYNNTVVNAGFNGITMYSAQSKSNTFYNNIVVNPGNYSKHYNPLKSFIYLEDIPGKVVDYDSANNYFSKDLPPDLFVDPANLDFRLSAISPAVDKGKDLSSQGITFDRDLFERPFGGAFDPGAFEYGSTIVNPPLKISTTTYPVTCNGGNNGSASVTVSGGAEPYSYVWSNGKVEPTISDLQAGSYSIKVIDNLGNHITETVTVNEPTPISITHTKINASSTSKGSIDIMVSGGTAPYTFIWSNGEISEDISNLNDGIYTVEVKDNTGCTTAVDIDIELTEESVETANTIIAAKYFSPNGDNFGDETWKIENVESIAGCLLVIFSQQGEKVFETNNYLNDWDGRSKGRELAEGAYFYTISCPDSNIAKKGAVRIIR